MRLSAFLGQGVVHVRALRKDRGFPGFDKKVRVSCGRNHVSDDRKRTPGTIARWRGWYDAESFYLYSIAQVQSLSFFLYML